MLLYRKTLAVFKIIILIFIYYVKIYTYTYNVKTKSLIGLKIKKEINSTKDSYSCHFSFFILFLEMKMMSFDRVEQNIFHLIFNFSHQFLGLGFWLASLFDLNDIVSNLYASKKCDGIVSFTY